MFVYAALMTSLAFDYLAKKIPTLPAMDHQPLLPALEVHCSIPTLPAMDHQPLLPALDHQPLLPALDHQKVHCPRTPRWWSKTKALVDHLYNL